MHGEIRYVLRGLARAKLFAAGVAITSAFAVGVVVVAQGVVDALLVHPLPYGQPDRLVRIRLLRADRYELVSPGVYMDWREGSSAFVALSAIQTSRISTFPRLDLLDAGPVERLHGASVTANTFTMLQVQPALGRTLLADDAYPGAEPTVVLSDGLWRRRFGADPSIIGRSLHLVGLEDRWYRVVGIMPPGFRTLFDFFHGTGETLRDEEFWIAQRLHPSEQNDRKRAWAEVVGRLKPGVPAAEAERELAVLLPSAIEGSVRVAVTLLHEDATRPVRPVLVVWAGAVLIVWLAACVAAANLILVRGLVRARELAVLAALGAGSWTTLRVSVLEAATAIVPGGVLGVYGGWAALSAVFHMMPPGIVHGRLSTFGWQAASISFGAVVLTALLCGAALLLRSAVGTTPDSLRYGGAATSPRIGQRAQDAFMVIQFALTIALLVGAAVLVNRFWELTHRELGFDPKQLITATTTVTQTAAVSEPARVALVGELLLAAKDTSGVAGAAITTSLPLRGPDIRGVVSLGTKPEDEAFARLRSVTPDYFRVMRIPLRQGRFFSTNDSISSPAVVLVSDTFARQYLGQGDWLRRFVRCCGDDNWRQVVGVVSDVVHASPAEDPLATIYTPYAQWPTPRVTLVARAEQPAAGAALAQSFARLSPRLSWEKTSMEAIINEYRAEDRFATFISTSFGGVTLLMAAFILYGAMARAIACRLRELAVRAAIGATRRQLIWLVMSRIAILLAVSLVFGAIGGAAIVAVEERAFGELTSPSGIALATLSGLGSITVGAFAAYLPVRRGMTADIRRLLMES